MAGTKLQFPKGFLWGTATSAHQVEGNNINSDWWEFEQHGGLKDHEISGIAVDHYNRFEEDFDIAESLFQNAHRFSVEWSRIEIQEGVFDVVAMNHYKDVIRALKKRGIKVVVTLFHFTLPLWLAKKGGWENSNSVKYFSRFVEYVARQIGDNVDFWITLNEPLNYARASYLHGQFPPGVKNWFRFLKVFNRLSSVHEEAYFAIHKALKGACIGISMNIPFSIPYSRKLIDKIVVWGGKQIVYKRFLSSIKASLDFIGLQYYVPTKVGFKFGGELFGIAHEYSINPSDGDHKFLRTETGWPIYPRGIYEVLKDLAHFNLPIIITENGIADKDDTLRARFIVDHLVEIHRAIQEGITIWGYFYWSLMDNFEWIYGRAPRFGLVEIDYENELKRIIRPSAYVFAKICENNALTV